MNESRKIDFVPDNCGKFNDDSPIICRFNDGNEFQISSKHLFGICSQVGDYEKLNKIGQGTYGVVYRARHIKSNQIYALKKMRFENLRDGFPISTIREISLLKRLKHPNIVDFVEIAVGRKQDSVFVVMEYCEQDLGTLVDSGKVHFTEAEIKCIMQQLFEGLKYMHRNYVVHRDLKVTNLLLNDKGQLKIADFGLARKYGNPSEPMSPYVVTLWYRAPELLLQSKYQSTAIDMWAAGCIFAELLQKKPLLPGKTEIEQLNMIIDLIGTPNDKIWPGFSELPISQLYNLKHQPYNNVSHLFSNVSSASIRLINSLLIYDPKKRSTARDCLEGSYFKESPIACLPSMMSFYPREL